MSETQSPTTASPRPFREIPGLWLQVRHMDATFFQQEAPRASARNTFFGALIWGLTGLVMVELVMLVVWGVLHSVAPDLRSSLPTIMLTLMAVSVPFQPLAIVGGFYLLNGIFYLAARAFSGKGSYAAQAYLLSLFNVPLGVAMLLVAPFPVVGQLLTIPLAIYALILDWRAVRVVHHLTKQKATDAAVAVPVSMASVLAVGGLLILSAFVLTVVFFVVLAWLFFIVSGLSLIAITLIAPLFPGLLTP